MRGQNQYQSTCCLIPYPSSVKILKFEVFVLSARHSTQFSALHNCNKLNAAVTCNPSFAPQVCILMLSRRPRPRSHLSHSLRFGNKQIMRVGARPNAPSNKWDRHAPGDAQLLHHVSHGKKTTESFRGYSQFPEKSSCMEHMEVA